MAEVVDRIILDAAADRSDFRGFLGFGAGGLSGASRLDDSAS